MIVDKSGHADADADDAVRRGRRLSDQTVDRPLQLVRHGFHLEIGDLDLLLLDDRAAQIRDHREDVVDPEIDADRITGLLVEQQHHGLAAAARFAETGFGNEVRFDQFAHKPRDRRFVQTGFGRNVGARNRKLAPDRIEHDIGVYFF